MIVYRELSSLEADLGFSAKTLYSLSNHIGSHYHKTRIPKGNGEYRELYIPDNELKAVQRKIAEKLLPLQQASPCATAYRPGGSTLVNARPHVGQPVLLKLDIRHFFDRIIYPDVKDKVFPIDQYSESNRILLAILCSFHGSLPQGAPTSPGISNIIMKSFDDTVSEWCMVQQIHYTRYCDDMTFSGDFEPPAVAFFVEGELRKRGFFLNRKKTVAVKDGQKKTVTGIVVNEKMNVSSDYRRKIRQEMHYCMKYGISAHLFRIGNAMDEKQYLQNLLGRVNYVLAVTPVNEEFVKYKEWLLENKDLR